MNRQHKTIGLINSMEQGGAERQMLFLLESGIVSEVITLSDESFFDTHQQKISTLPKRLGRLPKYLRPLFIPWYAYKLSRKLSRDDLVISFLERSNFVNIVANIFVRHKTVVGVRTNPAVWNRGLKVLQGILVGWMYPWADAVVANSAGARDFLVRKYKLSKQKTFVIPNAYDVASLRNKSEEPLAIPDEYYFKNGKVCVAVGRLEYPKAYWHLINAFREVVTQESSAKLLIVGEGSQRKFLETLVENFSLQKSVFLIGVRTNPFPLIKHANLLVQSSLWEGMPNVILDSLACGIPIVAMDCNFGPRDVVGSDVGILVKPFPDFKIKISDKTTAEESLLAEAILSIIQNKKAFPNFENASEKILQRFAPGVISEQWHTLIRSL